MLSFKAIALSGQSQQRSPVPKAKFGYKYESTDLREQAHHCRQ
ncbi:MAG: hypothetical protein P2A85_29230 (plasmid) [Microcoleus anatoxicus]